MNPPDQPCQATPAGDLRQQIMDSRVPKNEREWWASREIEKLERELAETERLRFGADADRRRLRCELAAASQAYDCTMAIHGTVMEERDRLATELTRLRALVGTIRSQLNLTVRNVSDITPEEHSHETGEAIDRLRAELAAIEEDGTEEHNAAVGLRQKLVAALARAEKAEAELAEAKVERETIAQSSLRSLEAYIDKLKQFAERAEKAEADNAKWQKLLLMSRDDREIDLISEIEEQARLLGMSGEREADLSGKLGRLESELAAIKNGHGELGKYEQLRLKNAELQRDKARLDWLAVSDTWFDYPATESFNPETFRDAIDSAIKGTP
jgi:chromosome segregation ATPase